MSRRRGIVHVVAAALLLTVLNAVKPLRADDPAYYHFATHMAAQPLDPYGFSVYQLPAMHILAPPVLPYWLGLGLHVVGDDATWLKLWLFPFCLLLTAAMAALLDRFAAGFVTPLLWATAISPAILPSVNLMLDVPALALGLTAVALFGFALDRQSQALVVVAGVVAGVAMQTKYSAMVVPPVLLLYGALHRRTSSGALAALVAVCLFTAWETLLLFRYGESHFLYHLQVRRGRPVRRVLQLVLPLVAMLGGLAPAIAVFGLAALGLTARAIRAAASLVGLGLAALAMVPATYAVFLRDASGTPRLTLNNLVFGALGLGVCATLAAVVLQLRRSGDAPGRWVDRLRASPAESFVVLWLALELIAYFVLSPFPGARRHLGTIVVATLAVGCLARRRASHWTQLPVVRESIAVALTLGLLFYSVDVLDAVSEKRGLERAVGIIAARDPQPTVWYTGCCGFQFYATRHRMQALIPYVSIMRKGDWLVVPDRDLPYALACVPSSATRVDDIQIVDRIPLVMMPGYYVGRTPMRHLDGPRRSVALYRAVADSVACAAP